MAQPQTNAETITVSSMDEIDTSESTNIKHVEAHASQLIETAENYVKTIIRDTQSLLETMSQLTHVISKLVPYELRTVVCLMLDLVFPRPEGIAILFSGKTLCLIDQDEYIRVFIDLTKKLRNTILDRRELQQRKASNPDNIFITQLSEAFGDGKNVSSDFIQTFIYKKLARLEQSNVKQIKRKRKADPASIEELPKKPRTTKQDPKTASKKTASGGESSTKSNQRRGFKNTKDSDSTIDQEMKVEEEVDRTAPIHKEMVNTSNDELEFSAPGSKVVVQDGGQQSVGIVAKEQNGDVKEVLKVGDDDELKKGTVTSPSQTAAIASKTPEIAPTHEAVTSASDHAEPKKGTVTDEEVIYLGSSKVRVHAKQESKKARVKKEEIVLPTDASPLPCFDCGIQMSNLDAHLTLLVTDIEHQHASFSLCPSCAHSFGALFSVD